MKNYCVYDSLGRILQYGSCPAKDLALQAVEPEKLKVFPNKFLVPEEQYYIDENNLHTICEDYDLESLPLPCEMTIEGVVYEVATPPILSFDAPGDYQLYITPANPKYRQKVIDYAYSP